MGSSLNMFANIVCVSLISLAAGQAANPLVPGNVPGLVPGSPAANQWWTNQLVWQQQQVNARGKRQAVPGNLGLTPAQEAQYFADQLQWQATWNAARGKREAIEVPAGVNPAACPNYPLCDLTSALTIVPLGYVNTNGYPAGLSAESCPRFPYCA